MFQVHQHGSKYRKCKHNANTYHIQWYRFKKDEAVLKAFDQYLDAPEPGKP